MLARVGLLLPRFLTGFAMGFANINFLPTLFDLFGASLMSENHTRKSSSKKTFAGKEVA